MINAAEKIIGFVSILDKSTKRLEDGRYNAEGFLYQKLLKLTRDINEMSGLILELNDLKLEFDLQEFNGLL